MKFKVYYMKPSFFHEGILGKLPMMSNIDSTHVFLKEVDATTVEDVFHQMQGECWSPNGEARDLIREKGLQHTSMSVGDVITEASTEHQCWAVRPTGFKRILPRF
jgi:hypothetical protein